VEVSVYGSNDDYPSRHALRPNLDAERVRARARQAFVGGLRTAWHDAKPTVPVYDLLYPEGDPRNYCPLAGAGVENAEAPPTVSENVTTPSTSPEASWKGYGLSPAERRRRDEAERERRAAAEKKRQEAYELFKQRLTHAWEFRTQHL
jgi:hypothetical protein